MTEKLDSPIRPTDDNARHLARTLIGSARFAALASLEPGSGYPLASRIAFATDQQGAPLSLMSTLAFHTKALQVDGKCSLLVGEPGKGDPLAHPRVSIRAVAEKVGRNSDLHGSLRPHYLKQHPKSELYIDFGDFFFFRFHIESAYLNGGFGKAFVLNAKDLAVPQQGL